MGVGLAALLRKSAREGQANALMIIFLHYYGTGSAETLAKGVRAAVAQLGTPSGAPARANLTP